jgi:hypothetical protein
VIHPDARAECTATTNTGGTPMNRPLHFVAGIVAVAATATLAWMPTLVMAGITFNFLD